MITHRPWPYALGVDDAAEYCSISPQMLQKLVAAGRAPSPITVSTKSGAKHGIRKLWLRHTLENWLDGLAGIRTGSEQEDDGGWSTPRRAGDTALRSFGPGSR